MAAIYNVGTGFDYALFSGACCAFGVFDGVHRGHRFIIDEAVRDARLRGTRAVVVTFDRDPDELFASDKLKKLMTNESRVRALAALDGVDAVVKLPFTREFAALEPRTFLDATLGDGHAPASLHVGSDFRFGARAAGDARALARWGKDHGMNVVAHELFVVEGAAVTSTRIRGLLAKGKIEQANDLLGHLFEVAGEVQSGRGEGADMGFATANVHVPDALRVLAEGVYAAYALIDGVRYKAAVSVGISPTFADRASANMEVHVLDFEGDLYGTSINVQFAHWLRPMIAFSSTDELISTVMGNIQWVRENL